MPEIELLKFITAFGGEISHEVDITHLAPLLKKECTFRAHIDTWVSPGWKIDFRIDFIIHPIRGGLSESVWVQSLLFEQLNAGKLKKGLGKVKVRIPKGLTQVILYYLSTGHGKNDEFQTKFNVIKVDGKEILRYKPWRNDCYNMRHKNPYSGRWNRNGKIVWSSDFPRSGWCPGDKVVPKQVELRDLKPGKYTFEFDVKDIDIAGTWRISSYIVGWKNPIQ